MGAISRLMSLVARDSRAWQRLRRGGRLGASVLGALLAGLLLLDSVVLKGERVVITRADYDAAMPLVLQLERVGEPHLIDLYTTIRTLGEIRGRLISHRLRWRVGV